MLSDSNKRIFTTQTQHLIQLIERSSHLNILLITPLAQEFFSICQNEVSKFQYYNVDIITGFAGEADEQVGCCFQEELWPFKAGAYDLIIFFHVLPFARHLPKMFYQIYHCLSASGKLSFFEASNFLGKRFAQECVQRSQYYHLSYIRQLACEHNFTVKIKSRYPESTNYFRDGLQYVFPGLSVGWYLTFEKIKIPLMIEEGGLRVFVQKKSNYNIY